MLDWCNATTPAHRAHLSVFRCTDPESSRLIEDEYGEEREEHDYPWEFLVQDRINHLHVPAHPPNFVLMGYDSIGLAAVIELTVKEFERYCFIRAVAVAHRVSGQGFAGEAIALADHVLEKYHVTRDFTVEARIDPLNDAAKRAFTKAGFEYVEDFFEYERWGRVVP